MNVEKKNFDNIFETIMDTDKTKDKLKARIDLEAYCSITKWMSLVKRHNGRYNKPKAPYCLTKNNQKDVCK